MEISTEQLICFKNTVWNYSLDNHRSMPWREDTRPYYVVVSEFMLQQTQVTRVLDKFPVFIERFPDFASLAGAALADVLAQWSGLGYNRRAKYLKEFAEAIQNRYGGQVPQEQKLLTALPGMGKATAAAVLSYSYNACLPYIETNVRTVLIHHFFAGRDNVSDAELMHVAQLCWDSERPREWCWALMDYGTYLKKTAASVNMRSKHYTKQTKFEGSDRQQRGKIIKKLTGKKSDIPELSRQLNIDESYAAQLLNGLLRDGLVAEDAGVYGLPE